MRNSIAAKTKSMKQWSINISGIGDIDAITAALEYAKRVIHQDRETGSRLKGIDVIVYEVAEFEVLEPEMA